MTNEKKGKQEEYKRANEYVESVYQENPPPYSEEELDGIFAQVRQLAPNVKLDRSWLERMIEILSRRKPECHVRPRANEEWEHIFPRYPISPEDGFSKSFAPDQVSDIRDTLSKFGLVVVRVFSKETCQATIAAMFEEINSMESTTRKEYLHPEIHDTWKNCNWPNGAKKFLVPRPAFHLQAFANRVDQNIYSVFSNLWQEHRLRVSIDNWGVTRGSTSLLLNDYDGLPQRVDKPRWGKGISPHWDYNPWLFVREVEQGRNPGYQGVVALNDHVPGMGCHRTLPGGMPFLRQWTLEHGCPEGMTERKRQSHRPKENDPILQYMQEIPLRRGDLLIWSWGQLHATANNESDTMRLHQYMRMFPAPEADPFYELLDHHE